MLKKIVQLLLCLLVIGTVSNAQVTTSSITGFVKGDNGVPLEGATITAVHQPTGTKYVTLSRKDGSFIIPNARAGGPYSVTISFTGFNTQKFDNITLELGTPFTTGDINLSSRSTNLNEVVVATTGRNRLKTGAQTNISPRMIATLPTISNSITDFTRLTPQANPSNNSFGGRDGRYNNVTIDGANLNNNFGLSNDPLPGGGANPIPIDAIQEISVNIAPYDVRQAQFTGANIAAVTKSGTNTFHGTAYGYYRNQSYQGLNVSDFKLPTPASSYNKIYGASIGGPIIKDKLFFFLNGEYEERSAVLAYYIPQGGTGIGNQSNVPIDSLKVLANYLQTNYKYDPGAYDNFNTQVPVKNHKYLARVDWNISTVHKLTLRYSELKNDQTFLPSQSGGINGANSTGLITYGAKFSTTAMAFGNTAYTQTDKVRTGSLDLTSNWNGRYSNQFLATISKIGTDKAHLGAQFPFVDIAGFPTYTQSKNNYLSFGNEPFNGNYNVVVNDVYTVTDNFSYYLGKHTLTAGVSYEFQKVGNGFMPGSQGYYAYRTLSDFLNNRAPAQFAITYSLIPGQDGVISANLKVGQLGFYAQDEINVNENLKVTAGLRVDKPVYPEQPLANKAVNALPLYDANGNLTTYNTGSWPKSTFYWSPRVGFRWNVPEEKLVVRGGTGVYTGRIPFVWLTNLPTGVGPYQYGALVTPTTVGANINNFLFNPDPHAYNPFYNTSLPASVFPTTGGTVVPSGAFALIDNNFKFPQIWRTDLAFDKTISNGWAATIEGVYTKDINSVYMFNANQKPTDATINLGGGVMRPSFSASAARKLNSNSGNAVVLTNASKGESFAFTALVSKSYAKGFYGQVSYTYTYATDLTQNPGSQANSVWSANPTSGTQNTVELASSNFAVPHRLMAYFSYRKEYIKHLATTIGIYWEGASQGRISYIYNGDVNNDGNSADLMYIPRNASEINFVAIPASGNIPGFTAQQQSDAFFAFVAQDNYLSKHMGQVAERNGKILPFYNRVDLKFAQEIFQNIGKQRHTLSFEVSFVNFLNLLNSNWGVKDFYISSNPLKYVNSTGGVANFQFATYLPQGATQQVLVDKTYINNNSLSSTWSAQIGLHYSF